MPMNENHNPFLLQSRFHQELNGIFVILLFGNFGRLVLQKSPLAIHQMLECKLVSFDAIVPEAQRLKN